MRTNAVLFFVGRILVSSSPPRVLSKRFSDRCSTSAYFSSFCSVRLSVLGKGVLFDYYVLPACTFSTRPFPIGPPVHFRSSCGARLEQKQPVSPDASISRFRPGGIERPVVEDRYAIRRGLPAGSWPWAQLPCWRTACRKQQASWPVHSAKARSRGPRLQVPSSRALAHSGG